MRNKLVIGISGASGIAISYELLQFLQSLPHWETHLVMTASEKRTVLLETDYSLDEIFALGDVVYDETDVSAAISNGSFRTSGMIVVPCSIKQPPALPAAIPITCCCAPPTLC